MFTLDVDLSAFERRASELGGAIDQTPFAMANAMTSAAFAVRSVLIQDTWPSHVTVRNPNFMSAALRIEKATKSNLSVAIYDALGRAHLKAHARGGLKRAARTSLAIPPSSGKTVHRTARGVARGERPGDIIRSTPRRALRVISGRGIFVGEGGRLWLRYSFRPSATIRPDVPFYDEFARFMRWELRERFPGALRAAMRTRRAR